jgi:hypothetical protein
VFPVGPPTLKHRDSPLCSYRSPCVNLRRMSCLLQRRQISSDATEVSFNSLSGLSIICWHSPGPSLLPVSPPAMPHVSVVSMMVCPGPLFTGIPRTCTSRFHAETRCANQQDQAQHKCNYFFHVSNSFQDDVTYIVCARQRSCQLIESLLLLEMLLKSRN